MVSDSEEAEDDRNRQISEYWRNASPVDLMREGTRNSSRVIELTDENKGLKSQIEALDFGERRTVG